jgi:glycine dehydrogenase subunit 1
MQYIPSTKEQYKEMLDVIGVNSFEELISIIPNSIRLKEALNIDYPLSEMELEANAKLISGMNSTSDDKICFLGGGSYDHYIPKVIDFLSSRSEFYTAYTPYQAEVSQGTLQSLYEFQTMICELSGMDVANASLYDGASALAEACSIAISASRKKKILISSTVNPAYIKVVKTYLQNRNMELVQLPALNGKTDISHISDVLDDVAGVVIQSPNFYGILENWQETSDMIQNSKALLIAISNPIALSTIKPPGESGAHIYVGEGQTLGNPMSYGGPYLGLIALKTKYMRKMPGRIVGKTVDKNGNDGFVLTLQTREQHIRRENATSNICTNQGLIALRATIYMALMGKEGLPEIAKLGFQKAHYLANKIKNILGYSLPYGDEFINEFIVKTNKSAGNIVRLALESNFLIGTIHNDETDSLLQIAVTEKRTKDELDKFVDFLKKI